MASVENYLVQSETETSVPFAIHGGLLPLFMESIQKCKRMVEVYHEVHKETSDIINMHLFAKHFNGLSCE